MKKLFFLIGVLFIGITVQAQSFNWVRDIIDTASIYGYRGGTGIETDNLGNVYTVGCFSDSSKIMAGSNPIFLPSSGFSDIFISKHSPSGNLIWIKYIGGIGLDKVNDIAITSNTDLILTGEFEDTVDFDPGVGITNLISNGGHDVFVLKLDSAGSFIWANSFGGSSADFSNDIDVDDSGNCVLTGYYVDTVDFNPAAPIVLTSNGILDFFVVKYNSNGNLSWAKSIGGSGIDYANAVTMDSLSNVYVTGSFIGLVDFDPGAGAHNINSGVNANGPLRKIYYLKLDAAGGFIMANSIYASSGGGDGDDIEVDVNGNIYLMERANQQSEILARLSAYTFQGNHKWTKSLSIPNPNQYTAQNYGRDLELDQNGGIVLTHDGSYWDQGNLVQVNTLGVAKYDTLGNNLWIKYIDEGEGGDVSIDMNKNILITGLFTLNPDFDPDTSSYYLNPGLAHTSPFILKLDNCSSPYTVVNLQACDSIAINNIVYDSTGNYLQQFTNVTNCDSSILYNITIEYSIFDTMARTSCDSFFFAGVMRYTSGNYQQAFTAQNTCDSTVYLHLTINNTTSNIINLAGCDSLTINGQTYTSSGTFTQTHTNAAGCDSILTLHLTINGITTNTITQSGCDSLVLNGQNYTSSGTYTQTYTNSTGCDSILTLHLTINYSTSNSITQSGCDSLVINGQTYSSSGTYTQTYTNSAACDSILTLHLTINNSTTNSITLSGCDSLVVNGQTYTSSGTYTQTHINSTGCDSVLTLQLTINNSTTNSITQSGCDSLVINGQTYTSSGTFTQTLTNAAGCDSILILHLTINSSTTNSITQNGCDSLVINGQTYTGSGIYSQIHTNSSGCDSVLTLNLTIAGSTTNSLSLSGCDSVTLNGRNYDSSGTYTQIHVNSQGCDSIISVNVSLSFSTSNTISQTGCNVLVINNQTYTSSGQYTQMYTNSAGCDSVLTLNLTINAITAVATANGLVLSANPGGATYQWINCNPYSIIAGATSQTFNVTSNGEYAVVATSNGCSDTSNCISFMDIRTNDIALKGVVVYPNPTSNTLVITSAHLVRDVHLQLLDAMGKVVLQNEYLSGTVFEIDISQFASGLYTLELKEGNQLKRIKVIKK